MRELRLILELLSVDILVLGGAFTEYSYPLITAARRTVTAIRHPSAEIGLTRRLVRYWEGRRVGAPPR